MTLLLSAGQPAADKRTRTNAVPVKGAHSGVPGLQDLVIMAYRHFGQFWNEPRPWENYRIKVRALFVCLCQVFFVDDITTDVP